MILLFFISSFLFLVIFLVVFFFIFKLDRKKHRLAIFYIKNDIAIQNSMLEKQQQQLKNVSLSIKKSENSLQNIACELEELSFPQNEYMENQFQNLTVFSENLLRFLKIYDKLLKNE